MELAAPDIEVTKSNPLIESSIAIIRKINNSQVQVVSIDMPSGLFPENNSNNNGAIIKANYTYTFEIPKISLLLPSYQCY